MKNRLCSTLIVLCMSVILFGCTEQTKAPTIESEQRGIDSMEPIPLLIEEPEWAPHGVFKGTVVISGEGIEETGYEGVMYMELDGGRIRISCTDAVRSRYGELF